MEKLTHEEVLILAELLGITIEENTTEGKNYFQILTAFGPIIQPLRFYLKRSGLDVYIEDQFPEKYTAYGYGKFFPLFNHEARDISGFCIDWGNHISPYSTNHDLTPVVDFFRLGGEHGNPTNATLSEFFKSEINRKNFEKSLKIKPSKAAIHRESFEKFLGLEYQPISDSSRAKLEDYLTAIGRLETETDLTNLEKLIQLLNRLQFGKMGGKHGRTTSII